jgi:hypothetical protein
LFVRLKPQQAPSLLTTHVNYASADKVVRIRVDAFEQRHAKPDKFALCPVYVARPCH